MIILNDKYGIESDGDRNYMPIELDKFTYKKDSEEKVYQHKVYFSSLKDAVEYCLKREVMININKNDYSLKEALDMINKLQSEYKSLLNEAIKINVED